MGGFSQTRAPLWIILLGVAGACQPVPPPASLRPVSAYLVSAAAAPEGSRLACVRELVRQGLSPERALERCQVRDLGMAGRPDAHSFFGLGGLSTGTSIGTVQCSPGSADPTRAHGNRSVYWTFSQHTSSTEAPPDPHKEDLGGWADDPGYKQLEAEADRAWQDYVNKLTEAANKDSGNNTPEDQRLIEAYKEAERKANEAINERDQWQPSVGETDPQASDACLDAALFVAECNANGWKSAGCARLLARMEGCGDPMLTDPNPEDPNAGCGPDEVDPEQAEEVALLMCRRTVRPVPGEDPCAGIHLPEVVLRGYWPRPGQEGSAVPCGDPRALTGEGQCLPSLTVVRFGERNIQNIMDEARKKFGGPIFIVPLPVPAPIGPAGPRPEHDEGEPGPPEPGTL